MYKLSSLRVESIGHLILNTIRFFSERKKKYLIIVSNPERIINRYVYDFLKKNYESDKIIFFENKRISQIIEIIYKIQKRIKILSFVYANIRWIHHESPRTSFGSNYRFYDSFIENKKKFFYEKKDEKKFIEWKKKNNIKGKFVCVFGRDKGYYQEKFEDPRNFKFYSFKKLIKKLIQLNYTVIRMGRKNNEKFLFNNKKYIDFDDITQNLENKNAELIEFMLFKNCDFMVGSTSGINAYALLFDKPFFLVNNFPAGRNPYFKNCIFINKKYKKLNKNIPYNKLDKEILLSEDYKKIKKLGYEIIDNNQNEIHDMVINNYRNLKGINISKREFIKEGSGGLCCERWYKKNLKLFKN